LGTAKAVAGAYSETGIKVLSDLVAEERGMEQPLHNPLPPSPAAQPRDLSPHLLSRSYEDYLDWLENQRRSRTRGGGGGRLLFGAVSMVATAFSLAGAVMRRR
jgi:hypothetical protein